MPPTTAPTTYAATKAASVVGNCLRRLLRSLAVHHYHFLPPRTMVLGGSLLERRAVFIVDSKVQDSPKKPRRSNEENKIAKP